MSNVNPFEGLSDAKQSENLPHLTEGKYLVEIDRVIYKMTRAGYNATVAEFTIVESSNPEHKTGSKRSYFQKMNVDAALGALKGFSAALAGIDPKNRDAVEAEKKNLEKFLGQAITNANPCKGIRVGVDVVKTLTKEKKDFSRHDWYPVEQA